MSRRNVATLTAGRSRIMPMSTGAKVVVERLIAGGVDVCFANPGTSEMHFVDVTVVILNNHAYAILQVELKRVGASAGGPKAQSLLDLSNPDIDFVAIAEGLGVPATRATTAEELADQFSTAISEPGPHLIDALIAPLQIG
jgi:acetolactate synthase-1/2/3 large subunit